MRFIDQLRVAADCQPEPIATRFASVRAPGSANQWIVGSDGTEPSAANRSEAAAELDAPREALAELEDARARYTDAIVALAESTRARPFDSGALVDLALLLAEGIIQRELSTDRAPMIRLVESAYQAAGNEEPLRMRIAPDDHALLTNERPELLEPLEVTPDPTLALGGCIIETERSIVDGSVSGRLERFAGALRTAMESET